MLLPLCGLSCKCGPLKKTICSFDFQARFAGALVPPHEVAFSDQLRIRMELISSTSTLKLRRKHWLTCLPWIPFVVVCAPIPFLRLHRCWRDLKCTVGQSIQPVKPPELTNDILCIDSYEYNDKTRKYLFWGSQRDTYGEIPGSAFGCTIFWIL